MAEFTPLEAEGRALFDGKAGCVGCHMPPLFTDYTFDNLGTPKNPDNPFYGEDQVFLDNGEPINPAGAAWVDLGLGGYLATLPDAFFAGLGLDKTTAVAENRGKQKVPTLRNVDLRPAPMFPKAYMHNGALKSLKEVVHFYNTRDVEAWPPPEVAANVNTDELGNLGLTPAEEDAVVAYMMTLSDGYVPSPAPPHAMMATHEAVGESLPAGVLRVRYLAPGHYQFGYHLAVDTNVEMSLFDVTGRRVARLGNGMQAAGDRSVEWRSGNLPNGIYLVHLRIGQTQVSGKVVVAH